MKRTFFNLFFLGVLLYAPWWVVFIVAVYGVFVFPWYVEILFAGLLFDILYGAFSLPFFGLGIIGFFVSLVLFFGTQKIKQNLR